MYIIYGNPIYEKIEAGWISNFERKEILIHRVGNSLGADYLSINKN